MCVTFHYEYCINHFHGIALVLFEYFSFFFVFDLLTALQSLLSLSENHTNEADCPVQFNALVTSNGRLSLCVCLLVYLFSKLGTLLNANTNMNMKISFAIFVMSLVFFAVFEEKKTQIINDS